jgi:large subunit ribosomal protein L13
MLPKNKRGKDALKKVKVFLGLPEEFKDVKLEKIEESLIQNRLKVGTVREYHYLGDISRQIGGKF